MRGAYIFLEYVKVYDYLTVSQYNYPEYDMLDNHNIRFPNFLTLDNHNIKKKWKKLSGKSNQLQFFCVAVITFALMNKHEQF